MNILQKILKKFTILFVLLLFFYSNTSSANPLEHEGYSDFLINNINNQNPNKNYVFSFKDQTYILEEYNISDNVVSNKAFTIKKENESPFLYLIDTNLYTEGYLYYDIPSITVDTYIDQITFSHNDLLKLIKKALKTANHPYQFVHFQDDPYLNLYHTQIDRRFINILLQKQSFAEKIGCSRLQYSREEFNTWVHYHYKDKSEYELYSICKKWLHDFINLDHMQNSVKSLDFSYEKQEFLDLLSECQNRLGLDNYSTISKTYQQLEIMKKNSSISDELAKAFEKQLLNFQNPLIAKLIKQIFDKGLNPKNSFHKLLASQILFEAELLTQLNNSNLSTFFEKYNFKELFNTMIDNRFENFKIFQAFPIENNLLSKMNDDEIKDMLAKHSFFVFHNYTPQEFQDMLQKTLNCLNLQDISEFYPILVKSLKECLSEDLSWSSYIWDSNPEDGEHFLKWFFCYKFIKEYDDFFINIASLWGYFFLR